jgi:hypothetical protein
LTLSPRESEMPGNVQLATPSTVLPYALSAAFTESFDWPVVTSGPYPDGRTEHRVDGLESRRRWALTRRLSFADWVLLRDFHAARRGPLEPFYAYFDKAKHDPTGQSPDGRYTVRFGGAIQSNYGLSRHAASFELIETR